MSSNKLTFPKSFQLACFFFYGAVCIIQALLFAIGAVLFIKRALRISPENKDFKDLLSIASMRAL